MRLGKVSGLYFLAILVLVSAVFFAMLKPFLISILLAGILAGLLYPLYTWIRRKIWNQPQFSAVACVMIVLLLIILPLASLMGLLTVQALQLRDTIDDRIEMVREKAPGWFDHLKQHPLVREIDFDDIDWQSKVADGTQSLSGLIIKMISKTSQSAVQTVAMSFIMLYTFFYFLIDGPKILNRIKFLSPLKDEYEDQIIKKFSSITRATIKGTVLIGGIQGVMGGILFFLCGTSSAVFWGTIMVILSVIPGVGAPLVWVPAMLVKFMTGHVGPGIGLLIGGLIISSIDNLLRPRLVGRDTKMHELMILFSTLGGIALFGIIGFILGPILAAVFITIMDIYAHEYREELEMLTYGDQDRPEHPPAENGGIAETDPDIKRLPVQGMIEEKE